MTVSVAHAQVSIATATTSGSNVMTLAMGRPNSPANSSGSSDTDAVVNSASTALRRLYFKTARSTKSSKNSSVPKVVVMGSSTTSTTETTINTSTESSSTLVTNVTTTDTSEACDSLDFVDISGQSEPLLSSFDEPITTVCINPSNLHEHNEADKTKTEIEMPLLGEYTEQANGPKIRSPVEYMTSKSTTTTTTTRFPFDIPTSPNKSVGVQEKDKNSFSTLKESFKKQKSIQSIHHNGKRDILNGTAGGGGGGGGVGGGGGGVEVRGNDKKEENKKKIENNLLSKCNNNNSNNNNNTVLKNERKSNGDDNDLCLEEMNNIGSELNKKPKKNSFRSRNRFLNSIKLSSSSSSSSSSASSTVSASANKEKYLGMKSNINSAPATIITMTTSKRQQNSNNSKYKETNKNSSIDSSKCSGGGGGGGDTTMFPFDREAIDYERIQRECFAVEEEEYDLNSTYNFSTTDRSSYDTDSPIEFEKPYFDSPSKSYKNFKLENFPYEHSSNPNDIYQQYSLLTHEQHIEMNEKKIIDDIGYGAVSKRNKSEKLTNNNNNNTHLEIANDHTNKKKINGDNAVVDGDDDDDDNDDAFTPKKLTDSMNKILNDHQMVSKFEQIASKFHQIPPKSSDAFFFNKTNQNDKNTTINTNNIITKNNTTNDDNNNTNTNKENHNNNTNINNPLNQHTSSSTIQSFPLSGAIPSRSSSPLPDVRVDHFTELQQQQQQQQQHQQQQHNQQKNNKLENCQQLTHNTGPINVTSNPMDTPVCTQPRATIVVQQASLSLDNTVETFLLKSEGDFISVEQGRELLSKKKHQQREENMRQLLDVTNTMTIEERRDFEMRYGSPHHCRSQSVKTPGSRASGRPNQLSLPQQRSRVASMPNTGVEEEYYRLRHFSITGKGVVNRGDSLKSRRSRSNNSVASSNSSTEHLTPANSARTSATCSLASSRESSTSNPATGPFRVLMLGGAAVGKSSLVSQFMTSEYLHAYDTSIDDESGEKSVSVLLTGEESELVFIDHATTEMSPENCLSSYDPQGYCVIYSSADQNSFMVAERVLQALWTSENIAQRAVILVGNKADLARSRVISSEEGKAMATAYDCKFIETSVGINHNVDELLVGLLSQIRLKIGNPAKSRDLFRKRSSRKSKRRACSPISTACLTGNGATNPNTPINNNGGPITNINTNDCNTPPGSVQSSPRKYRGSRTSASLKVKGLLGRVWARDSKSKSCENLHVL